MGRTVVCDTEGDGLTPTRMWCAVCIDEKTEEVFKFNTSTGDYSEFLKFAEEVDVWIGHNFIDYDLIKIFEPIIGLNISPDNVRDTLVMSKLNDVQYPGGHSIKNYGPKFGLNKPDHEDWSKYSEAMMNRCVEDTKINLKLYRWLRDQTVKNGSTESAQEKKIMRMVPLIVEQRARYFFTKQEQLGMHLNREYAINFLADLETQAAKLEKEIKEHFKPKSKPKLNNGTAVRVPKVTKKGTWNEQNLKCLGYENLQEVVGGPFSLFTMEEFNLGSPSQIVQRLNEVGWTPVERTDGYKSLKRSKDKGEITKEEFNKRQKTMWKVSEKNLETIPESAPESIRKLAYWKIMSTRIQRLNEWIELSRDDGRVHGRVDPLGTKTHRCSHSGPNMGNVPSPKKPLGKEARKCFGVPEGKVQLGVDASSIQLCALAHYLGDPEYIRVTCEGKSHDTHAEILGISRDKSKTFIYSFIMGGGDGLLGSIVGGGYKDGKDSRALFVDRIPGLQEFLERQKKDARRGFIQGLDGRLIRVSNAREVMSKYLQSFEAIIMKHAMVGNTKGLTGYLEEFRMRKLLIEQVAHVHDEAQFECDSKDHAEEGGTIVVDKFTETGVVLGSRCPLKGEAQIGYNWMECH